MPSLGPAEILVILVVALLVFGPDKMPEIGRQVARGVREFRRVQQHVSTELRGVVSELDLGPNDPDSPQGDPVPTLPPKPAPSAPEVAEATAEVTDPATNGHASTPQAAESPGPPGEPATSPPAEPA